MAWEQDHFSEMNQHPTSHIQPTLQLQNNNGQNFEGKEVKKSLKTHENDL
jgi:hypothetical protein